MNLEKEDKMSNIKRYIETIADELVCENADCGICLDCQINAELEEWGN